VTDELYQRLLDIFCRDRNDVELHLINVTLGPRVVVAVFPCSLSTTSVPVEY
jgi:hypothetical protein